MQLKDYSLLACSAVIICFLYVFLSPRLAAFLYRPILFHPWRMDKDTTAPVVNQIQGEDVEISQLDGNKIYGWFFPLPQAKYTVLISHGNGGNISSRIDLVNALLEAGMSVFIYDYVGYGKSTGLPDTNSVCQSACSAYDYLINTKKIPANRIILYGESLGGAVSVELATRRKAKALILQSTFTSLYEIALEKLPMLIIYPPVLFPYPELNTIKKIA